MPIEYPVIQGKPWYNIISSDNIWPIGVNVLA